ncbi:MAG: hypothetical protein FWB91_06645 [Defluviitaleaceae bacterium]|nr:hypothetical protein [Defluviitaleaceae bacterium]
MPPTFSELLRAVPSFQKLSMTDLPISSAYKVHRLISALQPDLDFFNEQMTKEGINQDELLTQAMDIMAEKIKLPLTADVRLSANDISALLPFFDFEFVE